MVEELNSGLAEGGFGGAHGGSHLDGSLVLGEFAHVLADSLAELVDVVFLSVDSLFLVVFFFFEGVQVGPEFGDFFAEFFDAQMVDVEGLSALGQDLLLLFALGLAFVGLVLLGSAEVSTIVEGHVGDGLPLLFLFRLLQFSLLSFLCDLLLFLLLSFLHLDGAFCFAFLDPQSELFQFLFILLPLLEVGVNQPLELDEVLLVALLVDVVEIDRLAVGNRQLGNVQGWGLGCWGFLLRFWFWFWLGFWFFFDFFFNFFFDLFFFFYFFFDVR